MSELYVIRISEIKENQKKFNYLGWNCIITDEMIKNSNSDFLFFHITNDLKIFFDDHIRWDFNLCPIYDLREWIENKKKVKYEFKKNKEENKMFENYVITDVTFGDLNLVALKVAMKEIAKELDGVEIVKEGTEMYLVKDGTAVKIDGEEFQLQVKNYVEGKTMAELKKNSAMYKIITKLGLINRCTLEKSKDGLSNIFG